MTDEGSPRRGRGKLAAAVLGIAGVIGAFLTWAVSAGEQLPATAEGVLRLLTVWLLWTLLLAGVLVAGILRMRAGEQAADATAPPSRSLLALALIIAIVGLTVVQLLLIDGFGGSWLLYASLVLCIVTALAMVHVHRRRS